MPPWIPEIEIAHHADAPRVRSKHHERHTVDAIQRHRVSAELIIKPLMGAFAKQVQIEFAQNWRKAVGVLELDDVVAETSTQLVAFGAARQRASEQPRVMNPRKRGCFTVFADGFDIRGFRQERAHHVPATLGMQAEIVKWVGVATFHNRIGLRGKFAHEASPVFSDNIRIAPVSGTRSQSGRWANSYSIS